MLNLSMKYLLSGILWHLKLYFPNFFSAIDVRPNMKITPTASDKKLTI